MKNSQLNRVVRLISQTGDKAIVFDEESDNVVVMMPLDSYEGLVGVDTYEPDFSPFGDASDMPNFGYTEPKDEEIKVEDIPDFGIPGEDPFAADGDLENSDIFETDTEKKNQFAIPSERLNFSEYDEVGAEVPGGDGAAENTNSSLNSAEKLDDIPHDDEEEKFYLEPVE